MLWGRNTLEAVPLEFDASTKYEAKESESVMESNIELYSG
jgi:hypothetical protein